jgi:L-alanine-DL-glutamate epimerase-like enolase superfamily enzyme
MRLSSVETFVVGNPPPGFGGRYFIFVKVSTVCGVIGYGEVYSASFGPEAMRVLIDDLFARVFENQSPFDIERHWHKAHGSGFSHRPDPTVQGVFSALEMACWDIVGKDVDKPVYQLLGGRVHERLRSYTYLYPDPDEDAGDFYNDADRSAVRAAQLVDEGFTAIKFDPAGAYTIYDGHQPTLDDLDRSVEFCRKIRDAVGNRADLLFGTHGQFTVSGAKRLAQLIEPFRPLWFEEPVPPDSPEDMAEVARSTSIPVATGERLCTKFEFRRILESRAASIIQPDLGRVGGLLEGKKIAAMAEAFNVSVAPHLYCGPIVGAANIQLAACSPNFLVLEGIGKWDGLHGELLKNPIVWNDGYVELPTAPGLGIELNEDVARAHPYEGNQLHLEMQDAPYDTLSNTKFAGG